MSRWTLWLVRAMAAEIFADCIAGEVPTTLTACAAMSVRELRDLP